MAAPRDATQQREAPCAVGGTPGCVLAASEAPGRALPAGVACATTGSVRQGLSRRFGGALGGWPASPRARRATSLTSPGSHHSPSPLVRGHDFFTPRGHSRRGCCDPATVICCGRHHPGAPVHSPVKTSAGGQGQWRRRRLPIPHAPTSHTSARRRPQPRESRRPGTPAEGVHFGFSGRQGIISILFNWNGKEKNVIMFYSHKRCCSMPPCV